MKHLRIFFFLFITTLAALSQAQVMEGVAGKRAVLKMGLYPPDLIMRYQQRLGITDEQRREMTSAVKTFQTEVAELQWNLQSEQQAMTQILAGSSIEIDEAMARVDKVLALENDFKRAHFRLLITLKNALTEEQINMIESEKKARRDRMPGAGVER